jgi:hypothetical protein
MMQMGDVTVEVYDIPYGERIIWGATAGMLHDLATHAASADAPSRRLIARR